MPHIGTTLRWARKPPIPIKFGFRKLHHRAAFLSCGAPDFNHLAIFLNIVLTRKRATEASGVSFGWSNSVRA
jgi:hypothetical protein